DATCDRVRNVVQFEVEKYRQPRLRQRVIAGRPMRVEELHAELDPAHMPVKVAGKCQRPAKFGRVERAEDGIVGNHGEHLPVAASLGRTVISWAFITDRPEPGTSFWCPPGHHP